MQFPESQVNISPEQTDSVNSTTVLLLDPAAAAAGDDDAETFPPSVTFQICLPIGTRSWWMFTMV